MKHFISLLDYSTEELTEILDRADELRIAWRENRMPQCLVNRQVGLWFYGNGFRNRVAFEMGARAMGASVSYIPGELGIQEPLEDIGHYLDQWFSLLVVRARCHRDLLYLSSHTDIPVINARTDLGHPCEIMGDLQFIRQHRGSLDGLKVVFVGEVSNLCVSWMEAAVRLPISVTQIAPSGYEADRERLKALNHGAAGKIHTSSEWEGCLETADVLYTDCWPKAEEEREKDEIRRIFLPYQITEERLCHLSANAVFLPCPPVTRGQEVSDGAMNSSFCLNHMAKEYLLHAQNAVLERIILQ